ncbi:unnamed protein product [Tetraodon nigroviridis]|uniref:Sodium/potassium/calcium exchanger 1 n=1 Tax=Tetraodon nigroviridis TaxID=99883 RepID=Q4SLY4_TETNG|nr:unnamed protein product [Tetraodon nigroviridis]
MYCTKRKRLQLSRVLFFLAGVFLCTLYQLTISARQHEPLSMPQIGAAFEEGSTEGSDEATVAPWQLEEAFTATPELEPTGSTTDFPASAEPVPATKRTVVHCIYVAPTPAPAPPFTTITPATPREPPQVKGEYPEDLFSIKDRRRGWVVLHIIGMMYMFIALAIVCDEFFVPALGVITHKLAISDDVAGATFMAAGGSAPELFTSLIGVFIAHSNVGIGTIVGSAVFNILFVIGMCALFSREVLHLTWWPLFRDVSFYILDLVMLIVFFLDNVIMWWESMMLVGGYTVYVIFMKFNVQIERAFKTQLYKHRNIVKIIAVEEPEKVSKDVIQVRLLLMTTPLSVQLKPSLQRGGSSASLHNSTMRNTIFQLMIHTLDPLGDGPGLFIFCCCKGQDRLVDFDVMLLLFCAFMNNLHGALVCSVCVWFPVGKFKEKAECLNNVAKRTAEAKTQDKHEDAGNKKEQNRELEETQKKDQPEDKKKSRRFFVVTFLGSILWIAVFSYLMVWWAHQVGETIGISEEIMGLTILAAGTSIPDLITSVIVARKGMGDMAVSSSVGSNIFDITVGLPVPWLMYSAIHGLAPVAVSSNGLFCAIVLLFIMLLFVIISIASCNWKMNKALGSTMFLLYFIFLVLSVMLEDRIIICPVSI